MARTCACAWPYYAHARGHTTRMRVATNRAGILLAIMRPGQIKNLLIWGAQASLLTHQSSLQWWNIKTFPGCLFGGWGLRSWTMTRHQSVLHLYIYIFVVVEIYKIYCDFANKSWIYRSDMTAMRICARNCRYLYTSNPLYHRETNFGKVLKLSNLTSHKDFSACPEFETSIFSWFQLS